MSEIKKKKNKKQNNKVKHHYKKASILTFPLNILKYIANKIRKNVFKITLIWLLLTILGIFSFGTIILCIKTFPKETILNFQYTPEYLKSYLETLIVNISPLDNVDNTFILTKELIENLNTSLVSLNNEILGQKENIQLLQTLITQQMEAFSNLNIQIDNSHLNKTNDLLKEISMQNVKTHNSLMKRLDVHTQLLQTHSASFKDLIVSNKKIIDCFNTQTRDLLASINSKTTNNLLDNIKGLLNNNINVQKNILNQISSGQKETIIALQSNKDSVLNGFNSALNESHQTSLNILKENNRVLLEKMQDVRNHNLLLHQESKQYLDNKLLNTQERIMLDIISENNRPKTYSTEATTKSSTWSSVFDKKN